eukprot:TRINITY_DN13629_c0_g1_i1.p3 TRINITY_DN13629_c0_g1~~TRINITY_DN13629_c0_g1_i1.p3  ORF type:complete len:125 (-),score=13.06 TRINITY_DN13629_c0_g1_i1:277-651(-)
MMPAQLMATLDQTGELWQSGSLLGKPVSLFFSTGTVHGGKDTSGLAAVAQFTHHGMIFVPPGYSFGPPMFDNTYVHGASSPYGAGTIAGASTTKGSLKPLQTELDYAKYQGKYFAGKAKLLSGK